MRWVPHRAGSKHLLTAHLAGHPHGEVPGHFLAWRKVRGSNPRDHLWPTSVFETGALPLGQPSMAEGEGVEPPELSPSRFQDGRHRPLGQPAVIGVGGFEPPTSCSPSKRADQPAPHPVWSGWRDLNPRPLGPEPSALPNCATSRGRGGRIRTDDFLHPKQALYQAELHPVIGGAGGIRTPDTFRCYGIAARCLA